MKGREGICNFIFHSFLLFLTNLQTLMLGFWPTRTHEVYQLLLPSFLHFFFLITNTSPDLIFLGDSQVIFAAHIKYTFNMKLSLISLGYFMALLLHSGYSHTYTCGTNDRDLLCTCRDSRGDDIYS